MSAAPRLVPGLCSVTLRALPVEEVAALAAECGLVAVEWGGDVHVPPGDAAAAERARRASTDHGLAIASYGTYLAAGRLRPGEVAAGLDTAAALGAPNVRVWTDWVTPEGCDAERRRRIVADLAGMAEAAAARDLTVSLEWHRYTLTETAASAVKLLGEVGAANLFTYWQPVEGLAVDAWLAELDAALPRLSHLHVFRWEDGDHRYPLAAGADLWPAVLGRVAAADGGSWPGDRVALVEFVRDDDADQLRADAAVLRSWLAGLG